MSIYVTVPSNAGGHEFEKENTNYNFKVRLLERLQLKRGDWHVALASVSLPTKNSVDGYLKGRFPYDVILGVKGAMFSYVEKDEVPSSTNPYKYAAVQGQVTMRDLILGSAITNGYSLLQNLLVQLNNNMNQARTDKIAQLKGAGTGVFRVKMTHVLSQGQNPGQNNEMEQLNQFYETNITISAGYQSSQIYTMINAQLAYMMGLIEGPGTLKLGPNMRMTFRDAEFFTLRDAMELDYPHGLTNSRNRQVKLKGNVNWNLYGMNSGWFEREFIPCDRTLRVFSNANSSSIIGNQVSDVLREVSLKGSVHGDMYFEPQHRQYLPVRQQEYEILHIIIDDLSGVSPKLGHGTTSVVLHFELLPEADGK